MAESNSNLNIIVRVRDEAAAALSRLSNDISDLGGSLNFAGDKAGILAGALAAIGASVALKSAIDAFAEGQAQMAKFDAILKTLPPNLQGLRDRILELADTALIKFGFSNESAAISIARLLQATNDQAFAFQAFQAAMDLSRYKGIGLEEATQALIISFQGMPRLLKQFGIEVDDHASKETILAAVMKATAGQAEAYAGTLRGQFDIIGNTFQEFQKSVGGVFAPAIQWVLDGLKSWVVSMGGVNASVDRLRPVVVGFAAFMAGVFVVSMVAATVALWGFIAPFATILIALITLAAGIMLFVTLWQNNWEQARGILLYFVTGAKGLWSDLTNFIKNTFGDAMKWIHDQLDNILSFFQSVVATVSKPITTATSAVSGAASGIFNSLKGILGFAEGGIVTRPTLAMVGEGGEPEAIIPLSRMRAMGGGGVTVVLQGDFYTTAEVAERFGNEIARIIKNQLNLGIRA